jgi:hypothetical protein
MTTGRHKSLSIRKAGLLPALIACGALNPVEDAYASQVEITPSTLSYCISLDKVTFFPFRKRESAYENFYHLLLTRSYISTNADEPGILSRWQFSPDGKTFSAEVATTAKWQDGTPVTPKEAAFGIAKGFLFREIGAKIKVRGADDLLKSDWKTKTIEGIRFPTAGSFQLTFDGDVANISGVVREALSTNARYNRVWPARLDKVADEKGTGYFDLVSKFPVAMDKSGTYVVSAHDQKIALRTKTNCSKNDFYVYREFMDEDTNLFTVFRSNSPQSLLAMTNPAKPEQRSPAQRQALIHWLRQAYSDASQLDAVEMVERHFLTQEIGFQSNFQPRSTKEFKFPKKLTILSGNPLQPKHPLRGMIESHAKAHGVALQWFNANDKNISPDAADVMLQGARHENGRQVWMQDALHYPPMRYFFSLAPLVRSSLEGIAANSSATVPVDNKTLEAFERTSWNEGTMLPVARYWVPTYSRKSAPIELISTPQDEYTFRRRSIR